MFFMLRFALSERHIIGALPPWWELIDYLFLAVSFYAVFHSSRHNGSMPVKISLWFFWALLAVAVIFGPAVHWMAYVASAGLVTTHFNNIRRIRRAIKQTNEKNTAAGNSLYAQ